MLRNICNITTFHTPIDKIENTEKKESEIISMIEGYINNSGIEFGKYQDEAGIYIKTIYSQENLNLSISIKKDEEMYDYYSPHFIVEIDMSDLFFGQEIIEDFINTITRFFSGRYINGYFLEYDQKYRIEEMNAGKKYAIKDLKKIDMESLYSNENKNLLDSILFLHYTLEKQIHKIGISKKDLETFFETDTTTENIKNTLSLSGIRMSEVEKALMENITIIHKQIQIIRSYFLKN